MMQMMMANAGGMNPAMMQQMMNTMQKSGGGGGAAGGKAKATSETGPGAKNELQQGLQLLLGRSVTKEDITYEVEAVDAGNGTDVPHHQATVSLPTYDGGKSFAGEVKPVKGQAEQGAALQAVRALNSLIVRAKAAQAQKKA